MNKKIMIGIFAMVLLVCSSVVVGQQYSMFVWDENNNVWVSSPEAVGLPVKYVGLPENPIPQLGITKEDADRWVLQASLDLQKKALTVDAPQGATKLNVKATSDTPTPPKPEMQKPLTQKEQVARINQLLKQAETQKELEKQIASRETGTNIKMIPTSDGEIPATFVEQFAGAASISKDGDVWVVDGKRYKFGAEGQAVELTAGILQVPNGAGGYESSIPVDPEIAKAINLDSLTHYYIFTNTAEYKDGSLVNFVMEGGKLTTADEYKNMDGGTAADDLFTKTLYRDDGSRITLEYQDKDDKTTTWEAGEFQRTVETPSGVKMQTNQNNGNIMVIYKDGSTETYGGYQGTLKPLNDYSYEVTGEFLLGPRTITLNPITGETFEEEKIGDDIIIRDANGNKIAQTPVLSGKDYNGIEAAGGFLGLGGAEGDFLSYYNPHNGGIDRIVTEPVYDPQKRGYVPGPGGYEITMNLNQIEYQGKTYLLSEGGVYLETTLDPQTGRIVSQKTVSQDLENRLEIIGEGGTVNGKPFSFDANGNFRCDGCSVKEADQIIKAKANAKNHNIGRGFSELAQVGMILNKYKSMSEVSNLLFGEQNMANWREDVDQFFASTYLGVDYWTDDICEQEFHMTSETKGTGAITTPGGMVQFIGHIEATKTAELPDGARFYKITYAVTAPSDTRLTPYMDESSSVDFYVAVHGEGIERALFVTPGTQVPVLTGLKNGASSSRTGANAIVFYGSRNYGEVCIMFVKKKPVDARGKTMDYICNPIVQTGSSYSNWQSSSQQGVPGTPGAAGGAQFNSDI